MPGGSAVFERLRSGGTAAARALGSAKHWVPWYNLHKTFQGLIDAHEQARHADALSIVVRLADWWMPIAAELDDDVFEAVLDTEYGGMNEAFAHLARLTGRAEFAAMALRFSHRQVLDPLLAARDELTGLHANTQIQKALGYAVTASVTGEKHLHEVAGFFWDRVTGARSVSIGGDSVREHFHPDSDLRSMLEDREGPESCNTYHLLKLTRALAEARLRPEHLDFAERALFNHVLASQHGGGYMQRNEVIRVPQRCCGVREKGESNRRFRFGLTARCTGPYHPRGWLLRRPTRRTRVVTGTTSSVFSGGPDARVGRTARQPARLRRHLPDHERLDALFTGLLSPSRRGGADDAATP